MKQFKVYAKVVGRGYLVSSPLFLIAAFLYVIGYNSEQFGITTAVIGITLLVATPWIAIGAAEIVIYQRRRKLKRIAR